MTSTSPRILGYTITRANTAERARLLLETCTLGRETADQPFTWHLLVNGRDILANGVAQTLSISKVIDSYEVNEWNEGQHGPTNRMIARALDEGWDYLLRLDDDIEFLTKRWLAKLIEASQKLGDRYILSPTVRGLRWQPPQSQQVEEEGIPLRMLDYRAPIGGICRLTPVAILREKPYVSDVRLPLGGGDAAGVGRWCGEQPFTFAAYTTHIRIKHAKTTNEQEAADPGHFDHHKIFQHIPWIPPCV